MVSFVKHGYVGVDLGSNAVKIAQMERDRDRLVLTDAAVVSRQRRGRYRTHHPIWS